MTNERESERALVGWQPIETAPKDGKWVLLFGLLDVLEDRKQLYCGLEHPCLTAGYWDGIDGAWSPVGGTWEGPWIKATHWQPLPSPPTPGDPNARQ